MSVVRRCSEALAELLGQPEDARTPGVVLMLPGVPFFRPGDPPRSLPALPPPRAQWRARAEG
jgi:hypothetical protein